MVVKTLSELLNSDEQLINSFLERVNENEISPEMFRIIKEIGRPREKLKIVSLLIFRCTKRSQNFLPSSKIMKLINGIQRFSLGKEDSPGSLSKKSILFLTQSKVRTRFHLQKMVQTPKRLLQRRISKVQHLENPIDL